jgi:hypothetical protein
MQIKCKKCAKDFNELAHKKPAPGQTTELLCRHCREYSTYGPDDFRGDQRTEHIQAGHGSKPR